jgi:hypothetical protein
MGIVGYGVCQFGAAFGFQDHHLPFEATLSRLATSLKPAGTLLVLDLYDRSGPGERLRDLVAVPTSCA